MPKYFKTFEDWAEEGGHVLKEADKKNSGSGGDNGDGKNVSESNINPEDANFFIITMESEKGKYEFLTHSSAIKENGAYVISRTGEESEYGFLKKEEIDEMGNITPLKDEDVEKAEEVAEGLKSCVENGVSEAKDDPKKIDNKEEFMDYVKEKSKEAHGDDYDEKKAEEWAESMLKKSRDEGWSWSELVGAVQNSF